LENAGFTVFDEHELDKAKEITDKIELGKRKERPCCLLLFIFGARGK